MRKRDFLPAGRGGYGGGGAFAPSPGFPPPGRTRPPGSVPSPAGRPRRFTIPYGRFGKPRGRPGDAVGNQRKAKLAQKLWEEMGFGDWMNPQSPARIAQGYTVPSGWTECPNPLPSCFVTWGADFQAAFVGPGGGACTPTGTCPTNQAVPLAVPINSPVWSGAGDLLWLKRTSLLPRYTVSKRFARLVPGTGPNPVYRRGFVLLPDQFAAPFPQVEALPETWYPPSTKPGVLVGAHPGAKPAVDFKPGGPVGGRPTVHVPVPPNRGDRERKEKPFNYGGPGKLYGALTEAADAAACYIEAKGGEAKGGTRAKFKQAWAIANDPDAPAFNPEAFAMCMAREQAQDAVIGRLSKGAAKAQNRFGPKRPGGYRGGGWGTRML